MVNSVEILKHFLEVKKEDGFDHPDFIQKSAFSKSTFQELSRDVLHSMFFTDKPSFEVSLKFLMVLVSVNISKKIIIKLPFSGIS